jgi:hypothetical protein
MNKMNRENGNDYLTEFVGLVKHLEGCSPPNIAV